MGARQIMPSSLVVVDTTVENQAHKHLHPKSNPLKTTTTATSLTTSGIGWGWGDILDSANLHSGTGEGAESGLSTWTWGLGSVTWFSV